MIVWGLVLCGCCVVTVVVLPFLLFLVMRLLKCFHSCMMGAFASRFVVDCGCVSKLAATMIDLSQCFLRMKMVFDSPCVYRLAMLFVYLCVLFLDY